MEFKKALGIAIKSVRQYKNITQESISAFSSRTYLSDLENGKKEASVAKINALAASIGVHPLTILALAYLYTDDTLNLDELLGTVAADLSNLKAKSNSAH